MEQFFSPVPPLAEQGKIVARIQSLELVISDYAEKAAALQVLEDTFPEALRKSILQEAVRGKLVPQDPSDEPAEALLERIRAEKQRLIKEGKIKRTSTNPSFSDGIILIMKSVARMRFASTMRSRLKSRKLGLVSGFQFRNNGQRAWHQTNRNCCPRVSVHSIWGDIHNLRNLL